jgi:hypothetical protein
MVGVCLVDFSVLRFSSDFLNLGTLWGFFWSYTGVCKMVASLLSEIQSE